MANLFKMEASKLNNFMSKLAEAGMTAELAEELRQDPARLKRMVEAIVTKATVIFTVLVDYVQPKYEDLHKSAFDWANPDFARAKFEPIERCKKVSLEKSEVTFEYMMIDGTMSTDAVLAQMDTQGLRPALYEDLLAFAKMNPDEQRKHVIVALGSVAQVGGDRHVAYLYGVGDGRVLSLDWIGGGGGDWRSDCAFLVVRSDAATKAASS